MSSAFSASWRIRRTRETKRLGDGEMEKGNDANRQPSGVVNFKVLGPGFLVLGTGYLVLGSGFLVLGTGYWVLGPAHPTATPCPTKPFRRAIEVIRVGITSVVLVGVVQRSLRLLPCLLIHQSNEMSRLRRVDLHTPVISRKPGLRKKQCEATLQVASPGA